MFFTLHFAFILVPSGIRTSDLVMFILHLIYSLPALPAIVVRQRIDNNTAPYIATLVEIYFMYELHTTSKRAHLWVADMKLCTVHTRVM